MHITSQLQSESRSNQHPVFQPTLRQELNMFSDQLHPNGSHGFVQQKLLMAHVSQLITDRHIPLLIQTHLSFTSLASAQCKLPSVLIVEAH